MKQIKVQCPAKINLTLEVLNRREDGFHNIKSIMQTISLYDFLTVKAESGTGIEILLDGNSDKIPYDEKNLVFKAARAFLERAGINNVKISIFIEKNIPVEAGLAGGSTDGAGTFFALNELFEKPLNKGEIEELCASLGSDLNFCLNGGTAICTGRGENTEKLPSPALNISLIKPLGFGISAKEAYTKFAGLKDKSVPDNTKKMAELLTNGGFDGKLLYNSLENAVIGDYSELREIKTALPNAMMSGSGPTFFVLEEKVNQKFANMLVIEGLKTTTEGVKTI